MTMKSEFQERRSCGVAVLLRAGCLMQIAEILILYMERNIVNMHAFLKLITALFMYGHSCFIS